MLRIHICNLLIGVVLTTAANAQPLQFFEDFEDNVNGWILFDNPRGSSKLDNGTLVIKNNTNRGLLNLIDQMIDPQEDFKITAQIAFLQPTGNMGLVFGALSNYSFNALKVYGDGTFGVVRNNEGQWIEMLRRQPLSVDITAQTPLELSIVKKSTLLSIGVNGEHLGSCSFQTFTGTEIGFSVEGNTAIAVDYLKVYQEPLKINLASDFTGFEKENLGPEINSVYAENGVIISHDGREMYVVRNGHPGNMGQLKKDDIWWSSYVQPDGWSRLQRLGKPLNNTGSNFVISVAPDGNRLLVANTYQEDGTSAGEGLSISTRNRMGWTVPQTIIIADFSNKSRFVDFCLSPDQRALLMAIDDGNTYGGMDLFVSFKEGDEWQKPINLGPHVNSFANDFTPFLGADGKTLYFASFGHPGYGSADLFVTRRQDESWTHWTDPQNLGADINTSSWDANLSIPASGEYAYLTSNENSIGDIDIFRIKLHETIRPQPVIMVRGKVLNGSSGEGMEAIINYYDLLDGAFLGEARSDPDGNYQIVLPAGESYSFLADKEGFFSIGENIDALGISTYTEVQRNLELGPITKGSTIRLNNVFFETGRHDLRPESYHELNRLIRMLEKHPSISIELAGHTDNVGQQSYNQSLSERRAQEVYQFLLPYIGEGRMRFQGYGESRPVADNGTETGREKNRRVEFTILTMDGL